MQPYSPPGAQSAPRRIERLEHSISSAGIALWEFNPITGERHWDAQMYRLTDWPLDQPPPSVGTFREQLVLPEDHDRHRRAQETVELGADVSEIEYRIRTPDGRIRHLLSRCRAERDAAGSLTRVFGTTLDVSELRAAQSAAYDAAQREKLTADAVGIGVWDHDAATGDIHWNDAMWRLYGRAPGATAPRLDQWLGLLHADDRAESVHKALRALDLDDSFESVVRVWRPDGQWRQIAHRSRIERDAGGRALRQIGVAWDVTEQKLAAAADHARAATERASRAKTEFLSRLSHDLRTPLNAILGHAQLLALDPEIELPELARHRINHIQQAGWQLLALFEEVLDISQIESGALRLRPRQVPLAPLLDEVVGLIAAAASERQIETRIVIAPDAPDTAWADRTRLAQVLGNLLSNGVKYNRAGGLLSVSVQAEDGSAVIAVRDQGHGISERQLEALFTPWSRLGMEASNIQGHGIGLAISLKLIEAMDGRLEVRSEPGIGSEFRIRLRAGLSDAVEAAPPHTSATLRNDIGGTVLLVTAVDATYEQLATWLRRRPRVQLVQAQDNDSAAVLAAVVQPDLILIAAGADATRAIALKTRIATQTETARLACAIWLDDPAAAAHDPADWPADLDAAEFLSRIDRLLPRC
ncbi:MAG: PAS domain-containing protein [Burkholderiaceae bacterium]